jgi:hypothetical protein
LCGATNTTERVFNFMGELANHLAAGAVLNKQRVFPRNLIAARDVCHFHE